MKRIFFILLPVFLALFLSSCSGMAKEMTADEMKAELGEITGTLPDTETTGVNLSQEDTGGYNADLQLTWKNECGRFSTEKTLESYSWAVAQNISQNIADVSTITLSWMVPYHSASEPSIQLQYKKKDGVFEQVDIQDRFTDNTFGADAFTITDLPSERAGSGAGSSVGKSTAIPYPYQPRHKVLILPVSHAPRHKSYHDGTEREDAAAAAQAAAQP